MRPIASDSSPSPFRAIVNPFVDIVVPVLNEEKIFSSIEMLDEYMMENSLPYRYQITIADNGSQGNTLKNSEKLGAKITTGSCYKATTAVAASISRFGKAARRIF